MRIPHIPYVPKQWHREHAGKEHCEHLLDAYGQLRFPLPPGMIHGDAYRGNLLRDGCRVVLADWDAVSAGPREIDLIPTLQAPRFGLPKGQRDAFIAANGYDIRSWDGYLVLRDIRELSTTSALLRDGHTNRRRSARAADQASIASNRRPPAMDPLLTSSAVLQVQTSGAGAHTELVPANCDGSCPIPRARTSAAGSGLGPRLDYRICRCEYVLRLHVNYMTLYTHFNLLSQIQ